MDCRKDAVDHILVEVLVFAHLVYFLPLLVSHLFFNRLCCDIITIKIFPSKLHGRKQNKNQVKTMLHALSDSKISRKNISYPWICCLDAARQESQSIGQVTYSKGLETPKDEILTKIGNFSSESRLETFV